jgi:hypothetical protein
MKRQPLIDLEEFERRMRQVAIRPEGGGDAVDELIRIVGGEGQNAEGNTAVVPVALSDNSVSEPVAKRQNPLIAGDFAEIEAALLRAAGEAASPLEAFTTSEPQAAELRLDGSIEEADKVIDLADGDFWVSGSEMPDSPSAPAATLSASRDEPVLPEASLDPSLTAPLALDRFVFVDDAAVSGSEAVAEEAKRSRRPIYIMAAVVLAGMAGIAVSASLKRDSVAEISQEPAKTTAVQPAPAESASANADEAATATASQQASADAGADATAREGDPAPQRETPARVISLDPAPAPDNASASLAAANGATSGVPGEAGAQSVIVPPPPAVAADSKKVKTTAVRPDGSLITADAPAAAASPEARRETLANETPSTPSPAKSAAANPSAHHAAAAKVPAKTAALPPHRPASVVKSAESKPHAGAAKTAAKTKPANDQDPQAAEAAAADPQPIAPAQAPAPEEPKPAASNGPLAFVDNAVNTISGATSKLLDWGRTPTAAHN